MTIFTNKKTKKVLGLFKAKGLLIVPNILPVHWAKLTFDEVAWVAENVEPRVWEVLPAAMLHFPANFMAVNKFPDYIQNILACLK